jgi:diacylglycerol O-acyltransferase
MRTMPRSKEADEPLSFVDAAWLRMDSPTNAMVIERELGSHPRFRQRVVVRRGLLGRPSWQVDPEFDLRVHVDRLRLPKPGDRTALAELIGSLTSAPLPGDRPLWHASVIEGFEGGTAVVLRIHHCIADGVALVRLFSEMCDRPVATPARVGLVRRRPPSNLKEMARRFSLQGASLGRLLRLPADPKTPWKDPLGHRKLVAWSDPISMSEVRRLATAVNGTANDILQSCVAGSVANYLAAVDGLPEGRDLRTLVPMFLQSKAGGLGNHFGLVFLSLPLCSMDPLDRVQAVKQRMRLIKAGEDARVAFAALDVLGMMSPGLEQRALGVFTEKARS